ncbi:unnamed protein product [marine sediment metagenome]|uniref:Uncharacterized protein n=1 Tax=marine sediment metagenome TaxID=412755 RepID=X1E1X8_9ZZZZ
MIIKKEVINMRRDLKRVARHMAVVNDELGSVKKDIISIKWVGYYLILIVTFILIRSLL